MPDYMVRLPDGRRVKVRGAPNEQAARQRVQQEMGLDAPTQAAPPVEAPTPARSERQQRGEVMGQYASRAIEDITSRLPFGLGRSMDALPRSFNVSDEMVGAAANVGTRIGNAVSGNDADPNVAGTSAGNEWERRVADYRAEQPIRATAEEIAAQAAMAIGTGGTSLGQSAGRMAAARPMASATAAGGAIGASAGAGDGENLQERLQNAAVGGGLGALLGPLGVLAARGAGGIGRAIGRATGAPQPPSRGASALISQADPNASTATPDGSFFGERIGPQGQELITALGQRSDEAGSIVQEAARARARERSGRVLAEVQMRTGGRRGINAIAESAQAEAQAKPLFDAARNQRINVTGDVRAAVRELDRLGVDVGRVDQRGEISLRALMDDTNDGADIAFGRLHQLVRNAEDAAGAAFRRGEGNLGSDLAGVSRGLRRQLRQASPEFAQASSIWRGAQQDRAARKLGGRVFQQGQGRAQTEADIAAFLERGDLSASEKGQFLTGVFDAIEGRTGNSNNAAAVLDKPGIRQRLALVFGDEEADVLADVIGRQNELAGLDRLYDPVQGSPTAPRLAATGAEDRLAAGRARGGAADAVDSVGGFLSEPVTGTRRAASGLVRGRMAPQEASDLASLMTRQDASAEVQRFLDLIEQERRRRGAIGLIGGASGTFGAAQAAPRD